MEDPEKLAFLRRQAERAKYVTAVHGFLVLAARLLTGYPATCHWLSLPQLVCFGPTLGLSDSPLVVTASPARSDIAYRDSR